VSFEEALSANSVVKII